MSFAKILAAIMKPTTPRTTAQLRDDLGKIDMAALESRVAELELERRGLLLRGTDADVLKNKQALDAASLDVERGQVATEELTRLIAEAEAREAAGRGSAAGRREARRDLRPDRHSDGRPAGPLR